MSISASKKHFNTSSLDLFEESPDQSRRVLSLPDADIEFYPSLFSAKQSDEYLAYLLKHVEWKQEKIKYYGKVFDLPRLTAWYGDIGKSYTYSGIRVNAEQWLPVLLEIKREIENISHTRFNSVLLNLYRGERDSVAWHSDDEPELGKNPAIGSVSFGDTRAFQFRHKHDKSLNLKIDLLHGSYLLMKGTTQQYWQHQIAKSGRRCEPRINLTFRNIG